MSEINFALCKKALSLAGHVQEGTSHQTRPKTDTGDASLLMESVIAYGKYKLD